MLLKCKITSHYTNCPLSPLLITGYMESTICNGTNNRYLGFRHFEISYKDSHYIFDNRGLRGQINWGKHEDSLPLFWDWVMFPLFSTLTHSLPVRVRVTGNSRLFAHKTTVTTGTNFGRDYWIAYRHKTNCFSKQQRYSFGFQWGLNYSTRTVFPLKQRQVCFFLDITWGEEKERIDLQ